MGDLSDDDYDLVSELDMDSGSESNFAHQMLTPVTSPPSSRASLPKKLFCTYEDCDKSFSKRVRLEEHLKSHQGIREHRCPERNCGKDFLRKTHLQHHIKSAHTNLRDYACTWEGCDKKFATGTRLRRHLKSHEDREQFACKGYTGCAQKFRKHETLQRHILSVHHNVKPFQCSHKDPRRADEGGHAVCGKSFETAEKLREHERRNHDQTRFSCSECLALLATGKTLLTDDGILSISDVYFSSNLDLQAHMKQLHLPVCEFCSQAFRTNRELVRHRELDHSFVEPASSKCKLFPCSTCGREFTKKGNLNVHVKNVHEKKRDFVCGETEISLPPELSYKPSAHAIVGCGKEFSSKASLEEHVRTAHLDLTSKRVERNKKRKAEQELDDDQDWSLFTRQRKPRKDKGRRRVAPLLDEITGVSELQLQDQDYPMSKKNAGAYRSAIPDIDPISDPSLYKHESDDDRDDRDDHDSLDPFSLSNCTMYGNNIYAGGNQYHYTEGQYPPGLERPIRDAEAVLTPGTCAVECAIDPALELDNNAIFDFEHEPELFGGLERFHTAHPVTVRSHDVLH